MMKTKYIVIFVILVCCCCFGYVYIHPNTESHVPNTKYQVPNTIVLIEKNSVLLGQFNYYSHKQIPFKLKNTGKSLLIIQSVKTSCGCTVAKYDKKPIKQGETTLVMLEYKPNSLGYFSKTVDVVCNVLEGYVRLKISGEVVEK